MPIAKIYCIVAVIVLTVERVFRLHMVAGSDYRSLTAPLP